MNLRNPFSYSTSVMALLVVLTACGKKSAEENENVVLQSYRLIDAQRSDEAIILLERELAISPDRGDYKVVLASAYAHKGGIKIQKLVPVIVQMEKLKSPSGSNDKKENGISEKINNGVLNFAALLTQYVEFSKTFGAIPVIDAAQATYIQHAIGLLNEFGPEIKPEDAVYRIVLETVLFKHLLSEGLIGEMTLTKLSKESTCRVDLEVVNGTVIRLGKLMIDIYSDLKIAQPKRSQEMKKLSAEVGESVSQLTIATTTMTVLDEASTIFLKQTVAENGFGKIFKCHQD